MKSSLHMTINKYNARKTFYKPDHFKISLEISINKCKKTQKINNIKSIHKINLLKHYNKTNYSKLENSTMQDIVSYKKNNLYDKNFQEDINYASLSHFFYIHHLQNEEISNIFLLTLYYCKSIKTRIMPKIKEKEYEFSMPSWMTSLIIVDKLFYQWKKKFLDIEILIFLTCCQKNIIYRKEIINTGEDLLIDHKMSYRIPSSFFLRNSFDY
uniref:Uncharacterized protein n=1 Tax=Amorphochlora amoebiformis TaxID=1561963 RepID=A0A6T6W0K2_9EUKA|mmetsp:Transcript_2677/g.3941  ORF Transcript_2677/g.3941 Transcript_2677/m.3941 type:complete len:212 (+) Transcript_2677:5599-6234(+)